MTLTAEQRAAWLALDKTLLLEEIITRTQQAEFYRDAAIHATERENALRDASVID